MCVAAHKAICIPPWNVVGPQLWNFQSKYLIMIYIYASDLKFFQNFTKYFQILHNGIFGPKFYTLEKKKTVTIFAIDRAAFSI